MSHDSLVDDEMAFGETAKWMGSHDSLVDDEMAFKRHCKCRRHCHVGKTMSLLFPAEACDGEAITLS
jgi:hypothetical protein